MKKTLLLLLTCALLLPTACGEAAPAPEAAPSAETPETEAGARLLGRSWEDLHQAWGEPDGTLSGFWGDVWALEDGGSVTLYYNADGNVQTVRTDAKDAGAPPEIDGPAHDRDPGELMTETQELLRLEDGQWYQSYVSSTADIRYVYLSGAEAGTDSPWGWYAIGTAADYALANLGTVYDDPSGGYGDAVS